MSKHYCRKGGAPVALMDIPPFADPGGIVQNDDRLPWEPVTYGRVRMVFRCCGTALVQFIDDRRDGTTYTSAIALDKLSRVPHGVMVSAPCSGAAWSMDLPCGHINGEGCDCGTIAEEATQGNASGVVVETLNGRIENEISAEEADAMVELFEGDDRYVIRRTWDRVAYCVSVTVRGRRLPFLGYMTQTF